MVEFGAKKSRVKLSFYDDCFNGKLDSMEMVLDPIAFRLRYIGRLLNKRIRVSTRISIRIWAVLALLIISAVVMITKIVHHANNVGTTTTIIDINMDNSFLTTADLKKLPIPQRPIRSEIDSVFYDGCVKPDVSQPRKKAALVVLARNDEIEGVINSMKSLERHFNQWFKYPWIFLNDEEFTTAFRRTVRKHTSAKVSFGVIPKKEWDFSNENEEVMEHIKNQGDRGIMYGQLQSYHKMCRFYSMYFYKHPLVQKLDWYWRVEPDVEFYCDLTYDPFVEMEKHNKSYGFTVIIKELIDTVPNLFRYTRSFIKENGIELPDSWKLFIKDLNFYEGINKEYYKGVESVPELIRKAEVKAKIDYLTSIKEDTSIDESALNLLAKQTTEAWLPKIKKDMFDLEEYNLCHFWSNFEIARTDLFLSNEYQAYFDFLEKSGGFYKERWGDAPIHSLAVGMFLNFSDIHYFRDIGYKHSTLGHCPLNSANPDQAPYTPSAQYRKNKFLYNKQNEAYWSKYDINTNKDVGIGCRCRCPSDFNEIENSAGSCMGQWINLTRDKKNNSDRRKLDMDKIEFEIKQQYAQSLKSGQKNWKLTSADIRRLSQERVDEPFF
ncbi:hypothetical protein PACTADRAFT_51502 [Pachysolen tannophilus NRRL Y-2460]|uniref:Glycosyltransferase family 15 protein n=1 Tax=Pachysolen tannophilus NRRL Y-2460 TaxID=669874 RepID=A0A1E4TPV7_PACTA|nr:hypothetical protein PACTADRAFT_51502 [Pachysolen tannophilus NRRL Y-2460]